LADLTRQNRDNVAVGTAPRGLSIEKASSPSASPTTNGTNGTNDGTNGANVTGGGNAVVTYTTAANGTGGNETAPAGGRRMLRDISVGRSSVDQRRLHDHVREQKRERERDMVEKGTGESEKTEAEAGVHRGYTMGKQSDKEAEREQDLPWRLAFIGAAPRGLLTLTAPEGTILPHAPYPPPPLAPNPVGLYKLILFDS
jgi:hypothetical protein